MEFINTRKIIKKERFESFNVTDFSKNDDVVSFLTTQDDGQRFLLIYNNSNNCQNIYIDFTGTNFLLTDYIKSYKNYMFYDLISDGIVLRAGNEILNNKKKALQFKILENGIICFKVFEFYAMKEQSKIKLENIENIFNRFSFLLMEKGLNFKNEIIFELKKNNNKPREKDLLKLIESFLSRFSRDINFYYENEDSYKTVFANIPETSKNNEEQLIFILNENNDQNFKFLKSEIFSLKCDNDITKKVFFIFEDLFTKEIFIRYGCELQQN
ncbi:MAG: hypothetical protein LBF97_02295, partial [Elusimicrobiota bacterium]|nr:hypothetical protein [Elusimicrobiota bacterium]